MKDNSKLIIEMGLSMGGVASGGPGMDELAPEKMAAGAFGEDDVAPEDDMVDELGEEGEGDTLECSREELRALLEAVELGEKSADEAFDQLCSAGEDCLSGLDADGEDMGVSDVGGLEPGGVDDMGPPGLPMEGIQRIANLLTEDPDIFSS